MPAYKSPNGTWFAKFNFKDWQGNTKQKKKEGFKTQKEAKAFERDFLNKSQANNDMLFSSLYHHYLEFCESRLKPTTLANKKAIIDLKVLPYFQNMPINEIEASTVMQWQNELLKLGYAETYLKLIHTQLTAIFNFANRYYKLPGNPARVCGSMGKNHADSMDFYTINEFNLFIKIFESSPTSNVVLQLLFWTGIRSGELLALTLNDFDFNNKTLSINKNYARLFREDLILDPKTPKSKRVIALPEFLCELVETYSSKLYNYSPSERLFQVTKSFLAQEMKRGSIKAGIKRIRVHDLRHSHASLLIEMGTSPLLIAERLGHERVETTLQTYSHLYPNRHNEIANKLQILNEDAN